MNVNKAIILGNVTADPKIKTTPKGQNVASFGLATNQYWTDKNTNEKKQKTEFHNIVAWNRLAEIAEKYINKGSLIYVEGSLQTRTWEGKQGDTKYKTEIVAQRIQLGPKNATTSTSSNQKNRNQARPQTKKQTQDNPNDDSEEINVEDIPF
ncbi:MAG TPA: single-stranded DNA-binding protein [Patescibacteria group bacterium]|nr:single-stranded DNA-binding protein [Patescibacteria group bacterium]